CAKKTASPGLPGPPGLPVPPGLPGPPALPAPIRPAGENSSEVQLADPVLCRPRPIYRQHRYLETIAILELGVRRYVDVLEVDGQSLADPGGDALLLLAQMTARTGGDGEPGHAGRDVRHSAAICSAPSRGSGAPMIGRPTTR